MMSLSDPVVQSYMVHSGILAVKVLGTTLLTSRMRMKKGVFANPEDAPEPKYGVVKLDDPDVERVRRAHLNDLENIPVFWVLGALYVTTGPDAAVASTLFRLYTAGRILHTVVYAVKPLPQPARAVCFTVPFFIMWYMGIRVIRHYASAV